ncbi:uncharacterized protein LOC141852103 [Brevipalpus obovatus]|uniref:uncharacterized protein LOC141852103 n=1 Tax=Brevipalpus obovatus TaxID=246614 RepID=UPI003D9EA2C3
MTVSMEKNSISPQRHRPRIYNILGPMVPIDWFSKHFIFTMSTFIWLVSSVPMRAQSLCPSKCACMDDKLSVNCKDAALDDVPIILNPAILELNLVNNHIRSISEAFGFYPSLQFLDLSSNWISSLEHNRFMNHKNLRVLRLQRNKLTRIEPLSLRGLFNLELLHLNENQLTELNDKVFDGLRRLEKLDLSQNRITNISTSAFAGLINLKSLSLRNNRLLNIPSDALIHVSTTLLKFDLGKNPIPTIGEDSFRKMSQLVDLRLDQCLIATISSKFSYHLKSLRRINLDGNQLIELDSSWFSGLNRLEDIVLSGNQFTNIPAAIFTSSGSSLKRIDLRNNQLLSTIDRDALIGLIHLKRLIVDSTPQLSELPQGLFRDNFYTIRELSLRNSSILSLDEGLLSWETLKFLDIRDNPLTCDCLIRWLLFYLIRANFTTNEYNERVLCASPEELRGRPLMTLDKSDLNCPNPSHTLAIAIIFYTIVVLVLIGVPIITWRRNRMPTWIYMSHSHSKIDVTSEQKDALVPEKRVGSMNQVIFQPITTGHHTPTIVHVRSPSQKGRIYRV